MVSVEVVEEALKAYNLTVADFHTYFVAANENAAPIWVHNIFNWKPLADYKLWNKGKIKSHFDKHASDFGAQSYDEYTQLAKNFASETNAGNRFVDAIDGGFVYRFEPSTNTIFVGTSRGGIKTFYKWDGRPGDAVIMLLTNKGLM